MSVIQKEPPVDLHSFLYWCYGFAKNCLSQDNSSQTSSDQQAYSWLQNDLNRDKLLEELATRRIVELNPPTQRPHASELPPNPTVKDVEKWSKKHRHTPTHEEVSTWLDANRKNILNMLSISFEDFLQGINRIRAKIEKWIEVESKKIQSEIDHAKGSEDYLHFNGHPDIERLNTFLVNQLEHGRIAYDTVHDFGSGEIYHVTGYSCKLIPEPWPTLCPHAEPMIPKDLLPFVMEAVKKIHKLPVGCSIHWCGHEAGIQNKCQCFKEPDSAPFVAHFDQDCWGAVASIAKGQGQSSSAQSRSLAEANEVVGKKIAEFIKSNITITRDGLAAATGISKGQVSNCSIWKAYRSKIKPKYERTIQLGDDLLAVIPDNCPDVEAVINLAQEQAEEMAKENRHNRRHGPS